MKYPVYHILNGDALHHQLPDNVEGQKIVFRESLIEGPVDKVYPVEFYKSRGKYFSEAYGFSPTEYLEKSENEIRKLTKIPDGSIIHLWFEHDVFCQVNYWFCIHVLKDRTDDIQLYYVGPPALPIDWHGFGGMNSNELETAYRNKVVLSNNDINHGISCWKAYANRDIKRLKDLSEYSSPSFPITPLAIKAYIESLGDGINPGRPKKLINDLLTQFGRDDFSSLFKAFQKTAGIYGYGDLQIKKIIREIQRTNK